MGVQLGHGGGEVRGDSRNLGHLIGARGQDDVPGSQAPLGGLDQEPALRRSGQPGHVNARVDRRRNQLRVSPEKVHCGFARDEGLTVAIVERHPGKVQRKVGRVHVEAVPTILKSATQSVAPLQELMLHAELREPITRREAGLACADNDGFRDASHGWTLRPATPWEQCVGENFAEHILHTGSNGRRLAAQLEKRQVAHVPGGMIRHGERSDVDSGQRFPAQQA